MRRELGIALLLLAVGYGSVAVAAVKVGGYWYEWLDGTRARVVAPGDGSVYSGPFAPRGLVTYQGVTRNVVEIGRDCCKWADALSAVKLPSTCTVIGDYAFYGCPSITELTLATNTKRVGAHAFNGCQNITAVTLPMVEEIGKGAFLQCEKLVDLDLGKYLKAVSDEAFYKCIGLTSVTLPETVTAIGHHAFAQCEYLESINIPEAVTRVGEAAFLDCKRLRALHFPEGVTALPQAVCWGCYELADVSCGSGVTEIGAQAFRDCRSMTSFPWPEALEKVDREAFWGCKVLQDIRLGDNLRELGPWAFNACEGATNIIVGGQPTLIPEGCFNACSSAVAVGLPETITRIDTVAFARCANLRTCDLPASVQEIKGRAFLDCPRLLSVVLPDSLALLGSGAYDGCAGLTQLTIGPKLKVLPDRAFARCAALTEVEIPKQITDLGKQCFAEAGLESITFADTALLYRIDDAAFQRCTKLSSIHLPKSLQQMEDRVFEGCTTLTSVSIPDGTGRLGTSFFEGCTALRWLVLPRTLNSIAKNAFLNCTALEQVIMLGTQPSPLGDGNEALLQCPRVLSPRTASYSKFAAPDGAQNVFTIMSETDPEFEYNDVPAFETNIDPDGLWAGAPYVVEAEIPVNDAGLYKDRKIEFTFTGSLDIEFVQYMTYTVKSVEQTLDGVTLPRIGPVMQGEAVLLPLVRTSRGLRVHWRVEPENAAQVLRTSEGVEALLGLLPGTLTLVAYHDGDQNHGPAEGDVRTEVTVVKRSAVPVSVEKALATLPSARQEGEAVLLPALAVPEGETTPDDSEQEGDTEDKQQEVPPDGSYEWRVTGGPGELRANDDGTTTLLLTGMGVVQLAVVDAEGNTVTTAAVAATESPKALRVREQRPAGQATLIAVYDLMGRPVANPTRGHTYIYRYSDGSARLVGIRD